MVAAPGPEGKQRRVPGQGLWGLARGGSASRAPKVGTAPAGRGTAAACQVMPLSVPHTFFLNILLGAGTEAPLTVPSTASAAGVLAPLRTLLLSSPGRAGCLCTPSGRGRVLEAMGEPAPAAPRTDLEGCGRAGQPCCRSAWWVAGLRWQHLRALILGQSSRAAGGSGGEVLWGEEEEAESKATGALSWTWLGSPEQRCCLRGVWSWQHFHGLCFLQDLPLLSRAGRFPYLLLCLRVAGGAWPCVLACCSAMPCGGQSSAVTVLGRWRTEAAKASVCGTKLARRSWAWQEGGGAWFGTGVKRPVCTAAAARRAWSKTLPCGTAPPVAKAAGGDSAGIPAILAREHALALGEVVSCRKGRHRSVQMARPPWALRCSVRQSLALGQCSGHGALPWPGLVTRCGALELPPSRRLNQSCAAAS